MKLRGRDRERPERDGVTGPVLAREVSHAVGVEPVAGGNRDPFRRDRAVRVWLELHGRERRDRRKRVRVDDREDRVGEFGEFVVELVPDATR